MNEYYFYQKITIFQDYIIIGMVPNEILYIKNGYAYYNLKINYIYKTLQSFTSFFREELIEAIVRIFLSSTRHFYNIVYVVFTNAKPQGVLLQIIIFMLPLLVLFREVCLNILISSLIIG